MSRCVLEPGAEDSMAQMVKTASRRAYRPRARKCRPAGPGRTRRGPEALVERAARPVRVERSSALPCRLPPAVLSHMPAEWAESRPRALRHWGTLEQIPHLEL